MPVIESPTYGLSPRAGSTATYGLATGPLNANAGPWYLDIDMFAASGNSNWDWMLPNQQGGNAGPYIYGGFSTSALGTAAQFSSRWWDRDFGTGGLWDVRVIHTTGNDVGIYSFRIDNVEFARLDGYSAADVNNNVTTLAVDVRIPPGRHRFSVVMVDTNPSSVGLRYYPGLQGVIFARGQVSGPASMMFGLASGRPAPSLGSVITLIPLFATGNTSWDNLIVSNGMPNAYEMYSNGTQNNARWWDVGMGAGIWNLHLDYATSSQAGIYSVQLDGTTVTTFDSYTVGITKDNRIDIPLTVTVAGTHRITLLMASKNASSSAYYGDISEMELRQDTVWAGPTPGPRVVDFTPFYANDYLNWNNVIVPDSAGTPATHCYSGLMESSGAQNAMRAWFLPLATGTWTFDLLYYANTAAGIYSVRIDDIEVGTIDAYNATNTKNVRGSVTGINILGTGYHKLSLVMASKNAASSAYYGDIQAIGMRQTA